MRRSNSAAFTGIYGAWIVRDRHGDCTSKFGWEIGHIISPENGGSDALFNLRPLQGENKRPQRGRNNRCAVTSVGEENVDIG